MDLRETLSYSFRSIRYRQVRSWLTILGIIVGIMAVVVLVGLAQGLKESINSQLQSFGPRTILVAPYNVEDGGTSVLGGASQANIRSSSGKLFETDFMRLQRIQGIDTMAKVIMGRTIIGYKGEEVTSSVYCVEPDIFQDTVTVELEAGRFLEDSDKGAAVVGNTIATDTFKKNDVDVGSLITVGDRTYRVVGVLKKTGNSFAQLDSVVILPFEDGEELFSNNLAPGEISAIRIVAKENVDVNEVSDEIEASLIASHKVTPDTKDFTLITPEFINNQVEGVTGTLTLFLGGIAAISLIIGGIGISNTMFTSVLERRKEIGVLKSVGMTESDIQNLFVSESGLIGIFGGFVGVILGWAVIKLISVLVDFPATFTLEIGFGALLFSALVGVVAGAIPASRAAKLDPIDALRYE